MKKARSHRTQTGDSPLIAFEGPCEDPPPLLWSPSSEEQLSPVPIPQSSKTAPFSGRQGFVRITSSRRRGAPLFSENRTIRVECVQNGTQPVIGKRPSPYQNTRHEVSSQPKQQSSPPDFYLTILSLLGVDEIQMEAIRKLPIKQAREVYRKILEEHPQEVEKLRGVLDPVWQEFRRNIRQLFEGGWWREAWREALEEAARNPQRTEEDLSWAEYKRRYQTVKEEILETLHEGDLCPLFYYSWFYASELLAEGPVLAVVQEWLFTKASNRESRENLKRLSKILTWVGGGRPELPKKEKPRSKREAVSRTSAVRRLLSHYEERRAAGTPAAQAYTDEVITFVNRRNMKDRNRKKRILGKFDQEVLKKDPCLSSLVKRKIWLLLLNSSKP